MGRSPFGGSRQHQLRAPFRILVVQSIGFAQAAIREVRESSKGDVNGMVARVRGSRAEHRFSIEERNPSQNADQRRLGGVKSRRYLAGLVRQPMGDQGLDLQAHSDKRDSHRSME